MVVFGDGKMSVSIEPGHFYLAFLWLGKSNIFCDFQEEKSVCVT